jgi:hypothetical protein
MKFNNIFINPPFNISVKDSTSGTGGDVTIGKRFRKKAVRHLKPDGNLGVICVKSILKDVLKSKHEVHDIDLMTLADVWEYNTCWTIERNVERITAPKFGTDICGKMFDINTVGVGVSPWNYHEFNRDWAKAFGAGTTRTLVELPQKANNFTLVYADVHNPYPAKPRFSFTLMESVRSYTVSNDPYAARMSGWVEFDTVANAEMFRKLIESNPAVQYFFKQMKLKGRAKDCSRFLKLIDLTQFKTGLEYATEWALTPDQIKTIETGTPEPRPVTTHPIITPEVEQIILAESASYNLSRSKQREQELGEIFTPTTEVIEILKRWPLSAWEEGQTWLDMAVGNGQLLIPVAIIKSLLSHQDWLKTIYATDIDPINISEFKQRLSDIAGNYPGKEDILKENVVKENALTWLSFEFSTRKFINTEETT